MRLKPQANEREATLEALRAVARALGAESRNPKWTSYGALELDVFVRSKGDFELFTDAAAPLAEIEFTHDLNEAPPHLTVDQSIFLARDYFNQERYWEAHEVLESVWRVSTGKERSFLQGLILVCAAYVHHQKGEREVALAVLRRAERQLDYDSSYHGIDAGNVRRLSAGVLEKGDFGSPRL